MLIRHEQNGECVKGKNHTSPCTVIREERKDLFQLGSFVLHNGDSSIFKIECDSLSDKEIACCAALLLKRLYPFSEVEGVPTGGIRLAKAFEKYKSDSGGLLIVDDVWTTGGSMREFKGSRVAQGAVLFSRSNVEPWVVPLFSMD